MVCTDPDCALLFVRRPGKSPKCPSCASTLQFRPVRKSKRRRGLLLALLLLLLAAGLLGWKFRPQRLVAVPNTLTGPVGSRVDMKVMKAGLFSKEDVTGHAVGVVLDPAVARFDQMTGMVRLVGPGGTVIRFQMGDLKTDVNLEAAAAANPEKITIEPHNVELGVGTTARLKLVGHYKDGTKADLTAAAEWKPQNDKIVFAMGGFLEGLAPGAATVSARYRATPEAPTWRPRPTSTWPRSIQVAGDRRRAAAGGRRPRQPLAHRRRGRRRQALFAPGVVATEDRGRPVLPGLGPWFDACGATRSATARFRPPSATDRRPEAASPSRHPRRRSARGPSRQARSPRHWTSWWAKSPI